MNLVDQGSGPPVLMVHGNPTWSFYFHSLIARLQTKYRCIAVDHLGCGLSDKPRGVALRLNDHVQHLVQVIEELDLQNATLVAHDWGGAIGLGALLRCRQRLVRIVLLNTAAFPPPFIPWRIRACRAPLVGRLAVQGLNVFARAATRMATARPRGLPPDVCAGLLAPYDSWSHRAAVYNFVADIPTGPHQPTWQTLAAIERELPSLCSLPRMLIWGMRDWCFRPECLDRFLQYWPDAQVVRLPNAGHYVLLDDADAVGRAIDQFLQATP